LSYYTNEANATPITGSRLAHCSRRPPVARAFYGLDLWRGTTCLVSPLLSQSARIVGTTPYSIQLAAIVDPELDLRAACYAGDLTLARAAQLARESATWKDSPPVTMPVSPVTPVISETVTPTAVPEVVASFDIEQAAVESESELILSLKAEVAQLRAEIQQMYAAF
jgi:hypothetical protein